MKCHNKTRLDYILDSNNLSSIPKCSNPSCNHPTSLNYNNYTINKYCSKNCENEVRVLDGTHPFQRKNRTDENGVDRLSYKSVSTGKCKFLK